MIKSALHILRYSQTPILCVLNIKNTSFNGSCLFHSRQNTKGFNEQASDTSHMYKRSNFLRDYFSSSDKDTNLEWENIKKQYIEADRNANLRNIDALIIDYLSKNNYWNQVKDFISYINRTGTQLNIGAVGKLLKFYYNLGSNRDLTEKEKYFIKKMYKDTISKYAVLDSTLGDGFIGALSLTEDWKEGLNIIEMVKAASKPTIFGHSSIASAAFINKDPDTGWAILRDMAKCFQQPLTHVYLSWFNYCLSTCKNDKKKLLMQLERILFYTAENNIVIGRTAVESLGKIFSTSLNWKTDILKMKPNGICQVCKNKLSPIEVSNSEFEDLKSEFYNRVLVGNNIFIKSTPKEQKEFLDMLDKHAPFDIVVDGLNVAYSAPNHCNPRFIVSVLKKFAVENKKILVLGRKHMLKWSKSDTDDIEKHAVLYLTNDLSYDDPFLLFASLRSPHTKFLSRDFMRAHKFLLKNERLQLIFRRWQQKNQMYLTFVDANEVAIIKSPTQHLPVAHKTVGWHVPFNMDDDKIYQDTINLPLNWLCLQPKN